MYIDTTAMGVYSEFEIRAMYPNTSFTVPFVPPDGYAYVFPYPIPAHDPVTQRVQQIAPELTVLDTYEQRWIVEELYATQAEKDDAIAAALEAKRVADVPAKVTMRQARLALLGADLLPSVTAAIAALPSPQKEAAQIEWEYSQDVERRRGLVLSLGTALGLSVRQLDDLFTTAATL